MNLRYEYMGPVTGVFDGEKMVLLVFQARKNRYIFYRPTTWCLRWQAAEVLDSTLEDYVRELLRKSSDREGAV